MADSRALTFTDKKKLEEELATLIEAKKRVAEDIKTARGFGDLSENAEYDAAKAKEAEVYGNISRIEQILRTATFIDDSAATADAVALGTVVRVLDMEYDEEDEIDADNPFSDIPITATMIISFSVILVVIIFVFAFILKKIDKK